MKVMKALLLALIMPTLAYCASAKEVKPKREINAKRNKVVAFSDRSLEEVTKQVNKFIEDHDIVVIEITYKACPTKDWWGNHCISHSAMISYLG